LVVYAGKATRIQMNATKTPLKVGSFDRFLNLQISLVILLQMAMCVFLAVMSYVWIVNQGQDHTYLALNYKVQGIYSNGFVQIVLNFFTFWILLSYLVPISLFVTLEIVKFWQGFIFINFDKMMKNPKTKEHAICRNSNLNEDLGRVEYIFSDKTGTLTSNEMQLRQISIKGAIYGDIGYRLEENPNDKELKALEGFDGNLARAARVMKGLPPVLDTAVHSGGSSRKIMAFHSSKPSVGTATDLGLLAENLESGWDATLGHHMTDFFTNLCLCHSLIIEDDGSYQGPSPDEVALVDAARQLGYEFRKRSQGKLTLNLLGKEVEYEILNVMEYSSDRGCMSVIARAPDGSVRLYCKGSDTKVMAKIRKGTNEKLLEETNQNLHTFACEGLRTLVLGTKLIPENEYVEWDRRYQEASCLFEGREDALDGLGLEIETDIEGPGGRAHGRCRVEHQGHVREGDGRGRPRSGGNPRHVAGGRILRRRPHPKLRPGLGQAQAEHGPGRCQVQRGGHQPIEPEPKSRCRLYDDGVRDEQGRGDQQGHPSLVSEVQAPAPGQDAVHRRRCQRCSHDPNR
jgi:magnesium-transporting ATPase (P-type)